MAQALIIIGAFIIGALGSIHLLYTFCTDKLYPREKTVKDAMENSSLVISKRTTMWKAWIGFNASHSLGAILLAAVYIPLAIGNFPAISNSLWFSNLPLLTSVSFLVLAKRYWFNIPLMGISVATACFIVASALINLNM